MHDTPPSVSAIVVNWNGAEQLTACLDALCAQRDCDVEIVVVDNGSSDDSVERIRREFGSVRLIEAGTNLGFAAACNLGIDHAKREWVALINNDAIAPPDWLAALGRAAREQPDDVGMLQTRLVFSDQPGRTNSTGVLFRRDATFVDRDFDAPADGASDASVFCVTAGAALYRRTMLEALRLDSGVFDPDFFMYFEDVDLGWRARLGGWRARYVDGPAVRHAFQGTATRHGDAFVALQCRRNRVRMLAKNGSLRLVARTLPRTLVDTLASTVRGGPGESMALIRAWRAGWAQRQEVAARCQHARHAVESRWVGRPC